MEVHALREAAIGVTEMMDMVKIALNEARRLRREESGVALMLTLSIFMLLYVVCAGVYSIGETVRQKVELQNACDSAAYSVAVVQADGLSRMAMVNRAMSWSYIQLTNMQIDYITYKWLCKVYERFVADRSMCRAYNASTDVTGGTGVLHSHCRGGSKFTQNGYGYFCGVSGKGIDYVRLNNHEAPVSINEIQQIVQSSEYERYAEIIDQFKTMIEKFGAVTLPGINAQMQRAMKNTAYLTMMENLPRQSNGERDVDLAKDIMGFYDASSPAGQTGYSPYDESFSGGYFSPLYNTELDERIFLSMADGEVYDNLVDYFGASSGAFDGRRCGGLDQWFVRGYDQDTVRDARSFEQSWKSLKNLGICRVYKNANLIGQGDSRDGFVYRAHHCGFGSDDCTPSCLHTHERWPEQCQVVPNSIGLCADYEWSSGCYTYSCVHIHVPVTSGTKHIIHYHTYNNRFLGACSSGHGCAQTGSHARSEYKSCWANGKRLEIPFTNMSWPWPVSNFLLLDCGGGFGIPGVAEALSAAATLASGDFSLGSYTENNYAISEKIVTFSNKFKPNGWARIYGDDQELVDDSYVGAVAQPWVLNSRFYGKDGAVIVGMARKQRNPWTFLLNGIQAVIGEDRTDEDGIYSAFNPVENGHIVAFSAARAAHRYHPSGMAKNWANGHVPFRAVGDEREYETRYDSVCDDEDGGRGDIGDKWGRFTVKSIPEYEENRIGCVCKNDDNTSRFARCWNLCETDWDATLLPLRFAWAEPSVEWYDSYLFDQGKLGNIIWESVGLDYAGRNPLEVARDSDGIDVNSGLWVRFTKVENADESGNSNSQSYAAGDFMEMRAPFVVQEMGNTEYEVPYGKIKVGDGKRRTDTGQLNLQQLIYQKIL